MKILNKTEEGDDKVDQNMNLAKAYRKRLALANDHMINVIYKKSKELQNTIKVLDYQQQLQKNPNSKHATKDYFEVKEIMLKKEAADRQK